MAKYMTVEMRFANDVDVYGSVEQDGIVNAVKTIEAVEDARVVGVGEGPDPVAPEPNPDGVLRPEENTPGGDAGDGTQG